MSRILKGTPTTTEKKEKAGSFYITNKTNKRISGFFPPQTSGHINAIIKGPAF